MLYGVFIMVLFLAGAAAVLVPILVAAWLIGYGEHETRRWR